MTSKIRATIIGCGGMARHHIRQMLALADITEIVVVCEPSANQYELTAQLFIEKGLNVPPNQPNLSTLLKDFRDKLDVAFIITPHVFHHGQTIACLENGLDVLLEKPMVMNAQEATSLIEKRDQTERMLVIAFPGSLSPQVRKAAQWIHSGEVGALQSISATVWQGWGPGTVNTWRQQPEISGGGFLFDTGAHMLNTVVDLAGEDFTEVAAWMDHHGRPVETMAVVIGRLKSGALVSLHASGEAVPSCSSDIHVFCERAILRTGIWGERLEIQRGGQSNLEPVLLPPSQGVWEQFLAVRNGSQENPCPPEVGLRMARLYDAIKASAFQKGHPIRWS